MKSLLFVLAAFLSVHVYADRNVARNLPSECKVADKKCGCENGQQVKNGCIMVNLDMGESTPWTGSLRCSLKVFADDQSPMVFTPESLYAVCGYTFKRLGNAVLSDGITPKEVVFSHPNGEPVHFVFKDGESLGRPDPGFHIKMDERLQMVDAQGWSCTHDPVYYDLYETDGTVRRFLATDQTNARGRLVSVTDSRGVVTTAADMGIDVIYGPDGVRQFLTPSRLADVTVEKNGYDVAVYPLADTPAKEPSTGLYTPPHTPTIETLSVRSAEKGRRAVITLRKGAKDPETYVFDYVRGDWSLTRPSGVEERRDRMIRDSECARTVKEIYSPDRELLSRDEYNYVWQDWGFAATNHVEGFGGTTRTTSWEYYTSGNGKGQVKAELHPSGLKIEHAYDANDRIVSTKRSGPDMMTEVMTYSYASVDPSDVVPPVDTRPRTVVKTLDGIECERTYYVYSPLTNIVERVGTQGAHYGGTNVLRTITAFYPVAADDVRSGMIRSLRREDGRLDFYDYALETNVWTETITHLHEQSLEPVSGKTTRDITLTNRRGETIERKTEAFIDGSWYTIARDRMTYNTTGKRIRIENLAGQTTVTDWDCCHKVSETQPDGSTTTWDYDDEGRIIASSRLIPLDLTNVTWLTTCYQYDALGRQVATWQTNYAAQVGLPATRTRYDQLGRVIARVDQIGNTTTTRYSPDGRTVSVRNPNTSTTIYTSSASGDILSISGTAVTPEFHTYGILPDGTRWSRTVQGETSGSPRFTKRYENMLGKVVCTERSGCNGTVLATWYAYSSLGRLVRTDADGEPSVEHVYDALGARTASIRSVDGEWRRTDILSSYVYQGGVVWQVKSNVVSCSDVAIAPLVTSVSAQLTGLSPETPECKVTADERGNATESWRFVEGAVAAEFQRAPSASNVSGSWTRYGILVREVSAVTNVYAYDALGRRIAKTDGRGNVTRTEYDAAGRQSATFDGAGGRTAYAYDAFGQLGAVTNPVGDAVAYEYDLRARKTYEGGATYPVRYTYGVFGDKTSMTTYRDEASGSGDVTRWLYDAASGVVTNKVYADGKGPSYAYTDNGALAARTWARGVVTSYAYDGWGNLTNTAYSDDTPSVSIRYDAMGRQVEVRDAAGVTTFAYDAFGSCTNETVVGVAGTNVIERYWDGYGRTLGYSLNGERRTTLAYEPGTGRITSMLAAGATNLFHWTYLPGSDLKETLAYPNGDVVRWEYEPQRDLLTLVSNATHSAYRYTYDAAGRRVTKNDERYGYNVRGELVLATNVVDGTVFAYAYDDIGNRLWSHEFGTNCTYAANELNQYTNIVRGGVVEQSAFDADGNQTDIITGAGRWLVEYNGENRPVRWTRPADGMVLEMAYDSRGRRVRFNADTFVYDGYLNVSTTIWDSTERIATRPLVQRKDAMPCYYFHDGNKNVSDMANKIKSHYGYSPFGDSCMQTYFYSATNSPSFSSEFVDNELGLIYYNFRHYAPRNGRWLNREPFEEFVLNGEDLLSEIFSPYCFVNNAPVGKSDFLGLLSPCAEARQNGLDRGDYGGVVCKNGTKHFCVWAPSTLNQGILYCLGQHERDHEDDIDCPNDNCNVVSRPGWKTGKDPAVEEQHAYCLELNCLLREKPYRCRRLRGALRTQCEAEFDQYISDRRTRCNP